MEEGMLLTAELDTTQTGSSYACLYVAVFLNENKLKLLIGGGGTTNAP